MQNASSWHNSVIYQIYPRSFNEVRPQGVADRGEGSLLGITEKLEYLHDLGVDVIWLSPFYPSPMDDNGYDVMDYTGVDSRYGTIDDFKQMEHEARAHNMRIMVDFVPNHTSDQHPWFLESASSRDNPKSNWYIWRDAKPDGSLPNNWASVFSLPQLEKRKAGELDVAEHERTPPIPAWTWHEGRGQYYLHTFAEQQPDLDWSNPEVQEAMKSVLRHWLDIGVDGFRVDAVNHIGKDLSLTDEPINDHYHEGVSNPYDQLQRVHSANYETLYDYLRVMTSVLEEPQYDGRELYMVLETYVGQDMLDKINKIMPARVAAFNFETMNAPWDAVARREMIGQYLEHLPEGSIPNFVNGNHDNSRLATRLGKPAALAASVINATLPGQMYVYQGEEANWLDGYVPEEKLNDHLGGRDPERTPMAWDGSALGGFSTVEPWLPVSVDQRADNITRQLEDPGSSVSMYRTLLGLRDSLPALQERVLKFVATDHDNEIVAYTRGEAAEIVIVVNMSDAPVAVQFHLQGSGRFLLSTLARHRTDEHVDLSDLRLDAREAVIIQLV